MKTYIFFWEFHISIFASISKKINKTEKTHKLPSFALAIWQLRP